MEGQHGLAPSPRGTLRSGFQHGAGDDACIHMSQVPLEVCFSVVMMREACCQGLDCDTQMLKAECDLGVGGSMDLQKHLAGVCSILVLLT